MNDFSALQKLIETSTQSIDSYHNLYLTLICFVGVNIIITIINIIFKFKLKNKDKSINSHNLREAKRMEIQEQLYKMLEEMTYYDGTETTNYQKKSTEINRFLTQKRLYLKKEIIQITQNFNDYFLTVLIDYRRKNFQTEMNYLEEYNKVFNND